MEGLRKWKKKIIRLVGPRTRHFTVSSIEPQPLRYRVRRTKILLQTKLGLTSAGEGGMMEILSVLSGIQAIRPSFFSRALLAVACRIFYGKARRKDH
jgi:hypothetical protein